MVNANIQSTTSTTAGIHTHTRAHTHTHTHTHVRTHARTHARTHTRNSPGGKHICFYFILFYYFIFCPVDLIIQCAANLKILSITTAFKTYFNQLVGDGDVTEIHIQSLLSLFLFGFSLVLFVCFISQPDRGSYSYPKNQANVLLEG